MLLSREYASLLDEDGAQQFAHKVVQKLAGVQVSSSLSVTADGLVGFALTVHSLTAPTSCSYSALAEALRSTALDTLPKRDRRQSGWFEANVDTLRPLIAARNVALGSFLGKKTPESITQRASTRAALQTAIRAAKSVWLLEKCSMIHDGIVAARGTSTAWKTVSEIRSGLLGAVRRPAPVNMQKLDGTKATTPEENATVFADAFSLLYGHVHSADASVIELLRQRPTATGLDAPPTDKEIKAAVGKLRLSAPGDSGLPAQLWKALLADEQTFALLRQLVLSVWETGEMPSEWETGLLSTLPKKGDRSQAGNYRGIMMLEVAYKILAYLMLMRLQPILESKDHVDHEAQCGFRTGRGCSDASFTLKQLVSKRREHGLESWIMLLDLVKAFDRVPRCTHSTIEKDVTDAAQAAADGKLGLLWRVLLRYGVPPKLVRLLIAMHRVVLVKFDVSGVVKTLLSIIGVKQGDLLGPPLFDFYVAAIMDTWRCSHTYPLATFRTRQDFVMTGRRHTTSGETFTISDSEYADDTGLPFCSRKDVDEQAPKVVAHFDRWGMEVHQGTLDSTGQVVKESKTELLFCSAPRRTYSNADTFDGADLSHVLLPGGRFMPVVQEFSYLGDIIASNGTATLAVEARVEAGSKAFGALRSCVFSSTAITRKAKRAAYEAIVLSITLFGCECWNLTEAQLHKLKVMNSQHIRSMSRVTLKHSWDHHIPTRQLQQELGLQSMDHYVARRQLRWLGHVSRMDFNDRLPRRMLSSWVPHPRPRGAPMMTYGRSARKALEKFSIDSEMWPKLAADRAAWKETLRLGHPAIRQSLRIARRPATDYRRLAGADRRRVTALDGERIHPQPGPPTLRINSRKRSRLSPEEQWEAEQEQLAARKRRLLEHQRKIRAAKRWQLLEQEQRQLGSHRPAEEH
jgi:hypothetical protein